MKDEKGNDEKIIAVPDEKVDMNYKEINELEDLPKSTLSKIKHFFKHYKDNEENKWCKIDSFQDSKCAIQLLNKYKKSYILSKKKH